MNKFTRGNGLLEDFLAKKRAEKANSLIPQSFRKGRILDIGCGSYPYFLINTDFKEKYGIDPSLKLSDVKNKKLNLQVLDITGNGLPFANSYFDVVTMLAVFEHIKHDKLNFALSEIKRLLKKDGIFVITTPAPWADKLLHFMSKFNLISKDEIHEHKHNYPKKKIESILQEVGFEKNKTRSGYFELGFNMWFVVKK